MTVLYVSPGACSLAAHSLVRELDLPILVETVALRVADSPIHRINPLGRVPALQLDDGTLITENSAILPYLADLQPDSGLIAPAGSSERALIQSWIGYKRGVCRRLPSAESSGALLRRRGRSSRHSRPGSGAAAPALTHVERHLADRSWLVGERYTIADAYLGVFAGWLPRLGERFADLHNLARAREAFQSRPATRQALAAEGQR